MTAIAIWHNQENQDNPCLWIASDSRVSNGKKTLIEDCAKMATLSVVCRSPDSRGFFSEIYHCCTFGYCFAGSTLMGQNTYLAITPLLSNLISPKTYIPSMSDIAQHMLAYLHLTFDDYQFHVNEKAQFEVAIFGFCHRTQQLSIFHFSPKLQNGRYQMTVTEYSNMKGNDFVYLGVMKEKMTSAITTAFSGHAIPGRPLSRIPRYVIQDFIVDEDYPAIGGDIQLGIADKFGFRPFILGKPRVKGQGEAYSSYLGRELTSEIMRVGEASVATNTMG